MLFLKTSMSISKIFDVDSFSGVLRNTHTMSNLECDEWFNKGYNDEMEDLFYIMKMRRMCHPLLHFHVIQSTLNILSEDFKKFGEEELLEVILDGHYKSFKMDKWAKNWFDNW